MMAPKFQKNNFPKWAVPRKGYVDIAVPTFELFDLALLNKSITLLNGQVLNDQKEFATMTVRLPQKNLVSLVRLPFVFWLHCYGCHHDFGTIADATPEMTALALETELEEDKKEILAALKSLPMYDDPKQGLQLFKEDGFRLVRLTNTAKNILQQ